MLRYFALFSLLLFHEMLGAQTLGWKWCIASDNKVMIDAWPTTCDKYGNVFLLGYSHQDDTVKFGSITVYNHELNDQLIMVKADTAGHFLWAVASHFSDTKPVSITVDLHGNSYSLAWYDSASVSIGPYTLSNPLKQTMYFLVKYDPTGNVLWAKNITNGFVLNFDGLNADIATDSAGNIYMTGNFTNNVTIGTTALYNSDVTGTTPDIFIAKFDNLGNNLWARSFGNIETEQRNNLAVYKNGDFFISGISYSNSINFGSIVLPNPAPSPAGRKKNNSFLVRFDTNGNPIWATNINRHVETWKMALDDNENIYLAGQTDSVVTIGTRTYPYAGIHDVFVAKYDQWGNFVWANTAGGYSEDKANCISVDKCGHLWICGTLGDSWGTMHYTMQFGSDTLHQPSTASYDPMFAAEYDTAGNYIQSIALASGGDDPSGIAIDNRGNFFVGGDIWLSKMTIGNDTISASHEERAFIAKYKYDTSPCITSIYFQPDTENVVINTSVCADTGQLQLDGPPGCITYLWNNGSTGANVNVNSTGTYWVVAERADKNIVIYTFNVVYKPVAVVNLGAPIIICDGKPAWLGCPEPGGVAYQWSTGSTDSSISVTTAGSYSLTVQINGCKASASVDVSELARPKIFLGKDTVLCNGAQLVFNFDNSQAGYLWSDGSKANTFTISEPGTYSVKSTNLCGSATDTVVVNYEICDLIFPTAFSPNSNGLNDIFRALGNLALIKDYSLRIYNRWGQQVFITNDVYSGWDGTFNGVNQDLGTYVYSAAYTIRGKKHMAKGDFQLIR